MLPASALNAATLLTLNVTQGVNALANGGNASVDGFKIDVTYGTPALAAQACAAPCTYFFESDNNPNVFMHGTVYTPDARWKVSVHNSGETLFRRGIVMKDIDIDSSESSKQESSPFQLPSGTPNGRLVLFLGKVDDVVKVRACARYTDYVAAPNGTTSAYTGWSVAVPHWQVLRTPSAQTAACP
jgi:hypothetical protein